jgi:hypothetical protein
MVCVFYRLKRIQLKKIHNGMELVAENDQADAGR